MGIAEDLADKLAADVIDYVERTGDEALITLMGQTLGDSSQTLQEAFVTSVRVQRAAIRAQRMLAERLAQHEGRPPPVAPKIEAPTPQRPAASTDEDAELEPDAPVAGPAPEPEAYEADTPEAEPAEPEADDAVPEPAPPAGRPAPPKRKPPVPTVGGGRPKFG